MTESPARTLEITQCLLCGSEPGMHTHFETHYGEAGEDHYLICERCGLVFQSPRLSQEDLEAFYSASYRVLVQGSAEPTDKDLRIQHARAKNLLSFAKENAGKISLCMDIGSSTGILLKAFREGYGCEVIGIEPGDAYREYSQREGITAVKSLNELNTNYERSFDLVTMAHTLEHLPEPLSYLRNLRERWLTDKGFILIEVPNLLGHNSFELAHLTAFTSQTLSTMLHQAGFEVVRIQTHGKPRSLLIHLYISVLAVARGDTAQLQSIRANSRWIRFRRSLGMLWSRLATRFLSRWAWLPWPEVD